MKKQEDQALLVALRKDPVDIDEEKFRKVCFDYVELLRFFKMLTEKVVVCLSAGNHALSSEGMIAGR
jgi:hypothetical protein